MKNVRKPTMDNTHNDNLLAGQVLAVHHTTVLAYFSESIKTFSNIIRYSLKPQFKINSG